MLKDFVSISSNIIQIHMNVEKLLFVLHNAELLENEMIAKIKQFKIIPTHQWMLFTRIIMKI
jgi:hypothetical protein